MPFWASTPELVAAAVAGEDQHPRRRPQGDRAEARQPGARAPGRRAPTRDRRGQPPQGPAQDRASRRPGGQQGGGQGHAHDLDLATFEVAFVKRKIEMSRRAAEAEIAGLQDTERRAALRVTEIESGIRQMTVTAPRTGTVIYVARAGGTRRRRWATVVGEGSAFLSFRTLRRWWRAARSRRRRRARWRWVNA